jgi:hypothetical protein
LNFPKYDGTEDPTSSVCRAEQFFDFQDMAKEDKVVLAAYHLKGEAQLWYQLFKETEGALWENLKEGLDEGMVQRNSTIVLETSQNCNAQGL